MSDSAFNDNDPSVYKTHILYMLPTDENCNKLLRVLEDHPINEHVFQQDVSKLSARPPWLDGVPILVDKSTSKAHKGRNIYAYIQEWKSDDFLPAGACTGGYASFESNGEDELGDASTKKFASLSTSGVFDLEEEGGGGRQQQQPAATASGGGGGGGARNQRKEQLMNEAQSKAQALMDARNMQDQRLKARVPAGGAKSPYQTQQPPQQQQQQPQYYQPQPPQQQQPQYYQPPQQQQQQQQYYRPPQPPQQQQPQYYQPPPQQQPRPPPYQQQQPSQYYYQPPSQQQQQQQQYQSSYF